MNLAENLGFSVSNDRRARCLITALLFVVIWIIDEIRIFKILIFYQYFGFETNKYIWVEGYVDNRFKRIEIDCRYRTEYFNQWDQYNTPRDSRYRQQCKLSWMPNIDRHGNKVSPINKFLNQDPQQILLERLGFILSHHYL